MSLSSVLPARADHWDELWAWRPFRVGMGGALTLYTALVLIWVFCVPLFGPADERAHVDYAWQVAHGHLPVAGTWFTAEFPQLGQEDYVQHVSNHPPLFYLVTGPLLRLTDLLGVPAVGLYGIRLLNAAATFLTVLVVARLAAEITARARLQVRSAVAVTAAVLVAVNPALLAASGAIQNDAPAVLLAAVVALLLARAAREGIDPRTVGLVTLCCVLGTLTRVTFITVVAVAVVAVAALTAWPGLRLRRPDPADVGRGVLRGAVVLAGVAAGAGWFLALNLHRYGDLTGGSAVYGIDWVADRKLAPGAASGPLVYLLHPHTLWTQLGQLVTPVPSISRGHWPYEAMTVVLTLVLAAAVVAAVRRRAERPVDRAGVVGLLVLTALFLGALAKLAEHVVNRGGANQRYLLDALGWWAVGGALLLLALGRLAPHAVALVGGLGAVGVVTYAAGIVLRTDDQDGRSPADLVDSLVGSRVPLAPALCVALLALTVVGLVAAVSSVGQSVREERAEVTS